MALVDIVMLVHDQVEWAALAVDAVRRFTKNEYQLIIVDSGSQKPETFEWLRQQDANLATVVHLAENRSFSHGVNVGVAAGTARFIIVLNDDAIVTEGWDTALLQDASPKTVGLVGARSNFASGAQGNPAHVGAPPWLVFVCVALRRDVWNTIGQMDEETFDGFSSEDIDYSWRVKKAGLALKVSNAYVLHAGSRTLAAGHPTQEALAKNNAKYNQLLVQKWGKEWVLKHQSSPAEKTGVVVTYHAMEMTRVDFMKSLMGLRRSDGVGFQYLTVERAPIHMARQMAADYAVDSMGAEWIVQLDDDATFPPDLLRRLLSHGKEVVCALAYQRKPPHLTCAFEIGDDGLMGAPLEGIEHTGLRKVDVSGFHCSIMHASVIRKLREAGIRQYYGGFDNKVGEDFAMCLNLKKVGVQVYCDTELISGHIGSAIVVDEQYKKDFLAGKK